MQRDGTLGAVVTRARDRLGDAAGAWSSRRLPGMLGMSRERAAILAYALVVIAGFVFYLVIARDQWIFQDEWDFLVSRDGADVDDLFRPHAVHWSTVPILIHRGLFNLVGIKSYLPYQVPVVALHLTAATLLRMIMRRSGVGPWVATVSAATFVLLGSGWRNIFTAFQITQTGSLVLGLTQLLLADHDGPVDRRDYLGLLAGAIGLMSSGVAVPLVAVVGLATLLRRGWRVALLHTVPLGGLFLAWYVTYGVQGAGSTVGTPVEILDFMFVGMTNALSSMGQSELVALLLGALLVIGLVVAGRQEPLRMALTRYALPLSLLAGAGLFLLISAIGRAADAGPEFARNSRYLYVVLAMGLPAMGVAGAAIIRWNRWFAPVVVLVLLAGVPGNVGDADPANRNPALLGHEELTLAVANVPAIHHVPRDVKPNWVQEQPKLGYRITAGWLQDAIAAGRVPDPGGVSPTIQATAAFAVSVQRSRQAPPSSCVPLAQLDRPIRTLDAGDRIGVRGGKARVWLVNDDGVRSKSVGIGPLRPSLEVFVDDVTLGFAPDPRGASTRVCGPSGT